MIIAPRCAQDSSFIIRVLTHTLELSAPVRGGGVAGVVTAVRSVAVGDANLGVRREGQSSLMNCAMRGEEEESSRVFPDRERIEGIEIVHRECGGPKGGRQG
jgi:hypothetical protein